MLHLMVVRWATTVFFLTFAQTAMAHTSVENTLEVRIERERLVMAMSVTLEEILAAQEVKPAADGGYDPATLHDAAQRHRGYLASHLSVEANGERLALQMGKVVPPTRFATPHNTLYDYEIICPGRRAPEVTFRHDMLREHSFAPGMPWQISYAVKSWSAKHSETRAIEMLRRDRPVTLKTGWLAPAPTATSPLSVSPQPAPAPARSGLPSWLLVGPTLVLATAWGWAHRRPKRKGNSAA